jgi:Arc/MetJ family transcription regulator
MIGRIIESTRDLVTRFRMRTTVTLDDAVVDDLMRFTLARSRTDAVNRAVAEYIRRRRLDALKDLRGRVPFDVEPEALRALDVAEAGEAYGADPR